MLKMIVFLLVNGRKYGCSMENLHGFVLEPQCFALLGP